MPRTIFVCTMFVLVGACKPSNSASQPDASLASAHGDATATAGLVSPSVSASTGTRPSGSAAAAPWPSALPKPVLPPPAPIAVTGYPRPLTTCLPDPAHHAGFTSDGNELGWCNSAMDESCEFVDRAGRQRAMSASTSETSSGNAAAEQKKAKEIAAWLLTSGLPKLRLADCKFYPPPLTGTFRFGDIKLSVVSIEGTIKDGAPASEATVKIGGSVAGDSPVHPFIYAMPGRKPKEPARYSNGTELNVLALSPDETELGIVTHTNCMEWCDRFEIIRMPVARFAAAVYNDAGFRAHKAKDYDRAIDLFARAAYIDPDHTLAPYNLACAYAKKSDAPKTEAALTMAIERGGAPVKERARSDADFKELKTAPWFEKLVSP